MAKPGACTILRLCLPLLPARYASMNQHQHQKDYGSPSVRAAQLWWPSRHLEMTSLWFPLFSGDTLDYFFGRKKISFGLGWPLPWTGERGMKMDEKKIFNFFHCTCGMWGDARAVPCGILPPITSQSHTHPSHSQTSRLLTSSLSLGVPVPRSTQCMWDT